MRGASPSLQAQSLYTIICIQDKDGGGRHAIEAGHPSNHLGQRGDWDLPWWHHQWRPPIEIGKDTRLLEAACPFLSMAEGRARQAGRKTLDGCIGPGRASLWGMVSALAAVAQGAQDTGRA